MIIAIYFRFSGLPFWGSYDLDGVGEHTKS